MSDNINTLAIYYRVVSVVSSVASEPIVSLSKPLSTLIECHSIKANWVKHEKKRNRVEERKGFEVSRRKSDFLLLIIIIIVDVVGKIGDCSIPPLQLSSEGEEWLSTSQESAWLWPQWRSRKEADQSPERLISTQTWSPPTRRPVPVGWSAVWGSSRVHLVEDLLECNKHDVESFLRLPARRHCLRWNSGCRRIAQSPIHQHPDCRQLLVEWTFAVEDWNPLNLEPSSFWPQREGSYTNSVAGDPEPKLVSIERGVGWKGLDSGSWAPEQVTLS